MLRLIWPLKAPNDESFHTSPKSIYDEIGGTPEFDYQMELFKYNESRWKKGWIHNVIPSVAYGTVLGWAYGLYESRRGLIRHMSRPRIIGMNILSGSGVALCISATHQALLMACDYKPFMWQPVIAGSIGGAAWSLAGDALTVPRGAMAGFVVGLFYNCTLMGSRWYSERAMTQFFATQQQQETPIHKVAPEMQRLYRAWLYDHRPLEDTDLQRRQLLVLKREADDMRLDSQSFMDATASMFLDLVEFPDWWPLKFGNRSEKSQMVEQRLRDDNYERRRRALVDNQIMLTHPMRTASGREISDSTLNVPRDRD
jgi:hypothetical protein